MIDIEIMMIGMVMSTCVCMVSGILYLHNEMEMGAFLLLGRRQLQNTYFL